MSADHVCEYFASKQVVEDSLKHGMFLNCAITKHFDEEAVGTQRSESLAEERKKNFISHDDMT